MKWIQAVLFICFTLAAFAQTPDFRKITWGMFLRDVQKIEGPGFRFCDNKLALEGQVELFGTQVTLRYSDLLGDGLFVTQAMYKVPVHIFPLVNDALQKKYRILKNGKYFDFFKSILKASPVSFTILLYENNNTVILIGYVAEGLLAFQDRNVEYISKRRLDDAIERYQQKMKKSAGNL